MTIDRTHKPIPLRRPFRLSAIRCERHPSKRVAVIGIPLDDSESLRCWCTVDCARLAGWPFLRQQARREQAEQTR